jgi:hypothetical protein
MYVYFEPQGGFNDILTGMRECLGYCQQNNRILLVNGMKTCYQVNFSDYFHFNEDINIILDTKEIKNICLNPEYKIYPNEFQDKMADLLEAKIILEYSQRPSGYFMYENTVFGFPQDNRTENIIIISKCGGGDGYSMFKELNFHSCVNDIFYERYNKLTKPYLCIQVRNTDYKCDYISFFNENEEQIRAFEEIYLATDDVSVIDFYKSKDIRFKNFTTFPECYDNYSLHYSNVNSHVKFVDMVCDLLIIGKSDTIMSNSLGCYIILGKAIKNGFWS